jgi:hypothetical protein
MFGDHVNFPLANFAGGENPGALPEGVVVGLLVVVAQVTPFAAVMAAEETVQVDFCSFCPSGDGGGCQRSGSTKPAR